MGFLKSLFGKKKDIVCAPVAGEAVPLNQVSDPTFGEEMLGKGIAIRPTGNSVVAPCDGVVDMMFDTGHAVTLIADFGAEILIHVGLDTVNLKGEHFKILAKAGDTVKKGDLLIEFDREAIAAAGYDVITPVVICNTDNYPTFETHTGANVAAGDVVIELAQ